jgi:hypothetical protein
VSANTWPFCQAPEEKNILEVFGEGQAVRLNWINRFINLYFQEMDLTPSKK